MILLLANTQAIALESNELGQITITLEETEDRLPKDKVVFAITKVAKINHGFYELEEKFENLDIDFNQIETSTDLEKVTKTLRESITNVDATKKTDENGECIFDHLDLGVYLIYPVDTAKYEDIAPFLVTIPTYDQVDQAMIYQIQVYPKHVSHPTLSVLKVDANNPTKTLSDATFTLYDTNHNFIQTVSTNKMGIAEFKNVKNGQYYLKEISAPHGYDCLKDEIEVTIDEPYQSNRAIQMTVANEPSSLIDTGDSTTIFPYMIIAGSSLGLIFIIVFKKKKSISQKK